MMAIMPAVAAAPMRVTARKSRWQYAARCVVARARDAAALRRCLIIVCRHDSADAYNAHLTTSSADTLSFCHATPRHIECADAMLPETRRHFERDSYDF
jgi:hypothetical protein